MKYTAPVIAKSLIATVVAAIGAATVAAGGPDLSVLSLGEWLGVLGTALTAGGAVFGTPNRDTETPADKITKGVEQVLANQAAAQAEVDKVKDVVGTVLTDVQLAASAVNLGPLAGQIFALPDELFRRPA
ncbi:holin [Mycobacterium phage Refuge]|uniref:Holin n=1 Tax=Mycobacterium phage Refuge TaxID=2517967 RepID=A0A482JEI6_9CAUD|nr:holin [Mycobacterium phage Refuge]QBP31035.1 holin [Mycobacterium phage Refuge]